MAALFLVALPRAAQSEPYLVQQGHKCSPCHVSLTGGDCNEFGIVLRKRDACQLLPASSVTKVGDYVRLGVTCRSSTDILHQDTQEGWDLEQARVYGGIDVMRLSLVIDELLAPDNAETREAWCATPDPAHGWYVRAGRHLPFGWRLQDNNAVRQVSGINMTTPDEGVGRPRHVRVVGTARLHERHDDTGPAARQFTGQVPGCSRGRLGRRDRLPNRTRAIAAWPACSAD